MTDVEKRGLVIGYLKCSQHYLNLSLQDPDSKRSDGTSNIKLAFQFAQSAWVQHG